METLLLKSMAELLAENYHNILARKKKMELEAKGKTWKKSWGFSNFHKEKKRYPN